MLPDCCVVRSLSANQKVSFLIIPRIFVSVWKTSEVLPIQPWNGMRNRDARKCLFRKLVLLNCNVFQNHMKAKFVLDAQVTAALAFEQIYNSPELAAETTLARVENFEELPGFEIGPEFHLREGLKCLWYMLEKNGIRRPVAYEEVGMETRTTQTRQGLEITVLEDDMEELERKDDLKGIFIKAGDSLVASPRPFQRS
ncbi:hypothetical protein CPB84DRAFT_1764840 [Gymnopilus junonius]|uniref:Uncharacterized protein n=1 Tax=Gymnopilus junonius TaxID=109634 RepID=A0A9P5NZM2_GYMJU|nr:hypothetical protein CPB84DRAFT_1764840 [Gymnopilus junonius]